jgi:hypothetical protein
VTEPLTVTLDEPIATTDSGTSVTAQQRFTIDGEDPGTAPVTVAGPPAAGQKVVIDDLLVSTQAVDMRLEFTESDTAEVLFPVNLLAGLAPQFTLRGKFKLPTADKSLVMNSSVAGLVDGVILWHSEA